MNAVSEGHLQVVFMAPLVSSGYKEHENAGFVHTDTHIHPLLGALIMANFPKVKSESKTSLDSL